MWIPLQSKRLRIALGVCCTIIVAVASWRTFMYPYGWSHCCDTQLVLAMHNYAQANHGKFPAGEVTPEASLSLLYKRGGSHEGIIEANVFTKPRELILAV